MKPHSNFDLSSFSQAGKLGPPLAMAFEHLWTNFMLSLMQSSHTLAFRDVWSWYRCCCKAEIHLIYCHHCKSFFMKINWMSPGHRTVSRVNISSGHLVSAQLKIIYIEILLRGSRVTMCSPSNLNYVFRENPYFCSCYFSTVSFQISGKIHQQEKRKLSLGK